MSYPSSSDRSGGSNMTRKQELFCFEYAQSLNATEAAIKAGYSPDSAYSIGYENLRKPYIQVRINELLDERSC